METLQQVLRRMVVQHLERQAIKSDRSSQIFNTTSTTSPSDIKILSVSSR